MPPPVRCFIGRRAELGVLDGLLDAAGPAGSAGDSAVIAIAGAAGIGKTALAVYWAHRLVDRFPHGQLYADLRGFGPDVPLTSADVLAGFLVALGTPAADVPAGLDAPAEAYRSRLAERRMVVVLDNAGGADQVRPLLPGAAGCMTLVTSRDATDGLVAFDRPGAPSRQQLSPARRPRHPRRGTPGSRAHRAAEMAVVGRLGSHAFRLGRYRAAIQHFEQALTFFRVSGDEHRHLAALHNLGTVQRHTGDQDAAAERWTL